MEKSKKSEDRRHYLLEERKEKELYGVKPKGKRNLPDLDNKSKDSIL